MLLEFSKGLLDANADIPEGVMGREGKVSNKRFNVYRNNVMSSLVEALGANFPAIKEMVGEEYFSALAAEFIRAHPPRQPVLSEYGGEFSAFIEAFPPLKDYAYLKDVAVLEWAWLRAFHSEDVPPLSKDQFAQLDPANLGSVRFAFHPSTFLLSSNYPVATLFHLNRLNNRPQDTPLFGENVLVCRPAQDVELTVLDMASFVFLKALKAGQTIEEAAEHTLSAGYNLELSNCLSILVGSGMVSAIKAGA
ncbi:HvfC/BufC N-terminal domain-containing protein [Flexibacterium corallicola]|uniref:HvfC/BufC N-terminal domain-containing protein n=1 Tax=Flexibacterium corallicola TaxID=3037259 RepID=UPI00286F6BDC|nr:DNA-binding domain-containing protein [Pseudovibrio sp. M1P-2-3]